METLIPVTQTLSTTFEIQVVYRGTATEVSTSTPEILEAYYRGLSQSQLLSLEKMMWAFSAKLLSVHVDARPVESHTAALNRLKAALEANEERGREICRELKELDQAPEGRA